MRLMPNFDLGKAIREDYNLRLLAKRSFEELITELLEPNTVYYDNIQKLFDYALNHLYLFPNIRLSDYDSIEEAIRGYLYKWIQKYIDGHNQKPLESEINSIGEIDEALLQHLVVYFSRDYEYLKTILEPIGWIWCAGEVYRAVDFCYILEDKSDILLQVKNKYNSENSSSSAIRDSTPITKWNRLNRPRKSNPTKPLDNWPELQKIVNCDDVNDALTENSYLKYIDDNSNIEFK